jgi:hypothetical protein
MPRRFISWWAPCGPGWTTQGPSTQDDACNITGSNGSLYGNGKQRSNEQGKFATGDRIGVLLDLGRRLDALLS